MSGVVVGVDQSLWSSGLAAVRWDERGEVELLEACAVRSPAGSSHGECAKNLFRRLECYLTGHGPEVCYLERHYYIAAKQGRSIEATMAVGGMRMVVLACAAMYGVATEEREESHWRETFLGRGARRDKATVYRVLALQGLIPNDAPQGGDGDRAEAIAIAVVGAREQWAAWRTAQQQPRRRNA